MISCYSVPGRLRNRMTSKGAKETIVSRLGFKSSGSAPKAEAELERVRKENAHLRRKIDELAKRHIKPPDCDKSKLLEVGVAFGQHVTHTQKQGRGCIYFEHTGLLLNIVFLF